MDLSEWACLSLLPTSTWTKMNLAVGIAETFATNHVVFSRATLPTSAEEVAVINRALLEHASRLHETGKRCLFFSLSFDSFINDATFLHLKKLGFLRVNFCIDMYNQWFKHCRCAKHYDAIGIAQSMNRERVARFFDKLVWMPMAATRDALGRSTVIDAPPSPSLCLVGSRTEYRTFVAHRMADTGVPMDIYGGRWVGEARASEWTPYTKVPRVHLGHLWLLLKGYGPGGLLFRAFQHYTDGARYRRVMNESAAFPDTIRLHGFSERQAETLFCEHLVNLGTSHMGGGWGTDGKCRYVQGRARDFEVTPTGAFYLAQWHPDIDALFESGSEIDTWRTTDELSEKCSYYFDHPDEAKAMGQRAKERVAREHTWTHRFEKLLVEVG
jgi:hypothetical protein